MYTRSPHVFCLTRSATAIARKVTDHVGGILFVPSELSSEPNSFVYLRLADQLQESFRSNHPIIGICAAGILVRLLAPQLRNKKEEPPVLCIAEDGSSIVPLLGGHYGANEIALALARDLGSHPAITTATSLRIGLSLDQPPDRWRLADNADTKPMSSALLAGKRVTVSGSAKWLDPLKNLPNVHFDPTPDHDAPIVLQSPAIEPLIYRRAEFTVGVGCVRHCPPDELTTLVRRTLADEGIALESVSGIYSIDLKSDEEAVHELAQSFGITARFYSAERLEMEKSRLSNPSERVFREVGAHGVSEAACLVAAGAEGELVVTKRKSTHATCAVAKIGLIPGDQGVRRGTLSIIGIGPGSAKERTAEANLVLAEADMLVGYKGYLDLVSEAGDQDRLVPFQLGEEERRCRFALDKAGDGLAVALVCSGDSGVYAMASLVMEILFSDRDDARLSHAARRVDIRCVPGVTAMQAASARAGALIGNDFCAVSLSDLMTPREAIMKRIRSAAESDFVIAFYNPASKRRKSLFAEAIATMRRFRPDSTPVLIARNLGRRGESVRVVELSEILASEVDMLTTVVVGSSVSRAFRCGDRSMGADGWFAFTPRGYDCTIEQESSE